ncbi:MAG: type IX secretion system membrane protein PorP/SprF, partial [Bacteroidales bacterium]
MKAIVSYFVILLTFSGILRGQDVHFSQSDFSPLLLNPSYTGRFHGDFRLINNYRSQWKTINKAYSTMDLTLDKPFSILGQQFGGGFIYLNDVSGNGSLTTNRFHCSFSYHEFWKNNQFSVGIQPGFVFRGFNHGNTTFPSQYNPSSGIYEPGLPDGEG